MKHPTRAFAYLAPVEVNFYFNGEWHKLTLEDAREVRNTLNAAIKTGNLFARARRAAYKEWHGSK